jgi:hypothetical protein
MAPPILVGQNPAPNVFTASLDIDVSATYDQDMDPATVNYRSFAVHAMQTGWMSETLVVDGGQIILSSTQEFHPGEFVQVSATTATLSLGAEGPITPTVWQFWAGVTEGTALFADSGQLLGNERNFGTALGDLDGDGDLDAYLGNYGGSGRVFLNDGTGFYTDTGQTAGTYWTAGVALGDLDGDGDLDVFESAVGIGGGFNMVLWNDGSGGFTSSGQSLGSSDSWYTALGDLDGDGDLDAFVPNGSTSEGPEPNRVYLNDGNGNFIDSDQVLGLQRSAGVGLGDLDGDGDLDAFVANGQSFPEPNKVWFNDGHGSFIDSGQNLGTGESLIVALGDLDGDGYLDAYVTNVNQGVGEADEVWINDGYGTFTLIQSVGSAESAASALGDLDGDGDLDAVVGGAITAVWLNDGTGTFTETGQILPGSVIPAVGDLNGDGSLDLFMGTGISGPLPSEVWFNAQYRHYLPIMVGEQLE